MDGPVTDVFSRYTEIVMAIYHRGVHVVWSIVAFQNLEVQVKEFKVRGEIRLHQFQASAMRATK